MSETSFRNVSHSFTESNLFLFENKKDNPFPLSPDSVPLQSSPPEGHPSAVLVSKICPISNPSLLMRLLVPYYHKEGGPGVQLN